jgi:hypothetical protein
MRIPVLRAGPPDSLFAARRVETGMMWGHSRAQVMHTGLANGQEQSK